MVASVRVALWWVVALVVCQRGLALADVGSGTIVEGGTPFPAGMFDAPPIDSLPCRGEYSAYAPTNLTGFDWTIWSDAPKPPVQQVWTVDYRARQMFDSSTSYEFGTPEWSGPGGFSPLSKLDYALDSPWHGLQIGVEMPNVHVYAEFFVPMHDRIDGQIADFDWNILPPYDDPTRLDSYTLSEERWCNGLSLDWQAECKLSDTILDMPVEFWPLVGMQYQRFDIRSSGINYVVPALGPQPAYDGVDVFTFDQQYFSVFFGGQLHNTTRLGRIPIDMTFQLDGGPTAGYKIEQHLLRTGERFTIDDTRGGMWHVGFAAEAHLTDQFSVGFQADYLDIRTTGTHHLLNEPMGEDYTWANGVIVKSHQSTVTAFVRWRF